MLLLLVGQDTFGKAGEVIKVIAHWGGRQERKKAKIKRTDWIRQHHLYQIKMLPFFCHSVVCFAFQIPPARRGFKKNGVKCQLSTAQPPPPFHQNVSSSTAHK